MLARLQQFTTLTLLAAAAAWAALFEHAGHTGWAWVGALLIVLGYALFLGVEFAMLAYAQAGDAAPRATAWQLARAWWGEVLSAPRVFCWHQPFRSNVEPDYVPEHSSGNRGVVLVHGFVCNRGFWNGWLPKLRAREVPFVAVNLEPVFGSIDAYPAIIDAAVRRIEAATRQPPVVVAHSMGGLAVRAWLCGPGADARVHRVITIGSPHRGTWLARYAVTPNGAQMQLDSPWLQQLAARETVQRRQRFTCFFGHCDNIVFPSSTATLADADNRHLPATAHVHMASHEAVFSEVWRWVTSSDVDAPAQSRPALVPTR